MRAVALCVAMLCFGCGGGADNTRADPLSVLRVGVHPWSEADAVAAALMRGPYTAHLRVDRRDFTLLVLLEGGGPGSALRLVTRRGTVLALDKPYTIDVDEGATGSDLDGDGAEEVVIGMSDALVGRRCLYLFSVQPEGVATRFTAERGTAPADACVERLTDVTGDGRPEAMVVHRHLRPMQQRVIELAVPLALRHTQMRRPDPASTGPYFAAETARRRQALQRALRALDFDRVYPLALELAAIARATGASPDAQVRAFDDALRGFVLSPAQARAVADARAFVAGGWQQ